MQPRGRDGLRWLCLVLGLIRTGAGPCPQLAMKHQKEMEQLEKNQREQLEKLEKFNEQVGETSASSSFSCL